MFSGLRKIFRRDGEGAGEHRWLPFSDDPLQHVDLLAPDGVATTLCRGSAPWFDPRSQEERRVCLLSGALASGESDFFDGVRQLTMAGSTPIEALFYQHWGDSFQPPLRREAAFSREAVEPLVASISGSQVRHLYLLVSGFVPGSLMELAEALCETHQLETLGLFFVLGASKTGDVLSWSEVGAAARRLQLRQLTLLVPDFSSAAEEHIGGGLQSYRGLKQLKVFRADEAHRYPAIKTPLLDRRD